MRINKTYIKRTPRILVTLCVIVSLFLSAFLVSFTNFKFDGINQAQAACPCTCAACCKTLVKNCGVDACACQSHAETKIDIPYITNEFLKHRTWIMKILWEAHVLPILLLMTEQITTFAVHQMLIVGSFFDAKHQLETQRLLQEMQALAHKEYQPSVGMCQFGTNTRSLAAADRNTDFSQIAFASRAVQRQLLSGDSISAADVYGDRLSRLEQLKAKYCNPKDFGDGLSDFCPAAHPKRMNKDINFTHTIEYANTLKIDFEKPENSEDEEDVLALSENLYGNETMPRISEDKMFQDGNLIDQGAFAYMKTRSFAAKRSVAQAAYAAQTALRAEGEKEVYVYMNAVLEKMGIEEAERKVMLGEERPSYYAQMEVLTKKLYQSPTFYSDLYDKPVNVDRKTVSMQAIDLMQKRDMYRSHLRNEAILAVWLETKLKKIENQYENEANKARQSSKPLELEGLK